jgi:pimeloyl-ACP methyl ester carboxylesterase
LAGLLSSSSALAGVDLLVPDLPGHGESEAAGRGQALSVANQTRWLLELLDTLGLDHAPHVCGSSMGGAVALHLAATQPARVASLMLVSPAGAARLPSWLDAHVAAGHSNLVTAAVADGSAYQAVLRVVMAKPPYLPPFVAAALARTQTRRVAINAKISRVGVLSLFLCLCVYVCAVCVCVCVCVRVSVLSYLCVSVYSACRGARSTLIRTPTRSRAFAPAHTHSLARQDIAQDLDQTALLPLVAAPSAVLWGAEDKVMHPDSALQLHQALRNARALHVLLGVGHCPHVEQPAAVAAAVEELLCETMCAPR